MMLPNIFTYAAFILICLVLLTLPFVPAYREWRHPTDSEALPISAKYTSDIDHFARRLHADVMAKLGLGVSTGYEDFDFATDPIENMVWGKERKRLISRRSIETSKPICSAQPLYVEGNLKTGAGSSFTALYSTEDIDLGAQSQVHGWAHADGVLRLANNCVALKRISAGTSIELGNTVWFERLHAPTLFFGLRGSQAPQTNEVAPTPASFADLPGAIQRTKSHFLIRGDCALPSGTIYQGSLVVTGLLTIGAGTTVVGDIKSREGVVINEGAIVQGAITCEKHVHVLKDAFVLGPLVSECDVLIGSHAVIGRPDACTTVSARNIIVKEGAIVHGTVWAHEIGMVKPA